MVKRHSTVSKPESYFGKVLSCPTCIRPVTLILRRVAGIDRLEYGCEHCHKFIPYSECIFQTTELTVYKGG